MKKIYLLTLKIGNSLSVLRTLVRQRVKILNSVSKSDGKIKLSPFIRPLRTKVRDTAK